MKLADVIRLLDKIYNLSLSDSDSYRHFLNFAIGFLTSAESSGHNVSSSDLISSYHDYLDSVELS